METLAAAVAWRHVVAGRRGATCGAVIENLASCGPRPTTTLPPGSIFRPQGFLAGLVAPALHDAVGAAAAQLRRILREWSKSPYGILCRDPAVPLPCWQSLGCVQ